VSATGIAPEDGVRLATDAAYGGGIGQFEPVEDKTEQAFTHMASIADLHVAPSGNTVDYSKAMRQMSHYFDVEKYQRERAAEILAGKYFDLMN
jgi:hypothetical protein